MVPDVLNLAANVTQPTPSQQCEHSVLLRAEGRKLTALCWQVLDESTETFQHLTQQRKSDFKYSCVFNKQMPYETCSGWTVKGCWLLPSDQGKAELSFLKPNVYHVSWECASGAKSVRLSNHCGGFIVWWRHSEWSGLKCLQHALIALLEYKICYFCWLQRESKGLMETKNKQGQDKSLIH